MGWLVRRILRNAISTLVTPANVERILAMVVTALGKLPVIGDQVKQLLAGVDLASLSETMAQQILDFILPLIPQTVGSASAMAMLATSEKEADEFLDGDLAKIQAALSA